MQRSTTRDTNDSIEYIDSDPGQEEDIDFELRIYDTLLKNKKAHKYILKHKGKAIKQNQDLEYYCCIQLQNINATRLNRIHDNDLRRNQINKIFLSLCRCVQFFHQQNIVHCDINIQNIFVDDDQNCKIINFRYSLNLNQKLDPVSLKRQYPIAPEINCQQYGFLEDNDDNSSGYSFFPKQSQTFKIDSYSLGVILFFLFDKSLNIQNISDVNIPQQQLAIIEGCLLKNYNKRWDINKIVKEAKEIYQSTRSIGTITSHTQQINDPYQKQKDIILDKSSPLIMKSQFPEFLEKSYITSDKLNKTQNDIDTNKSLTFSEYVNLISPKSIQNNFKKLTIIFQLFLMNYKMILKLQHSVLLKMVLSKFNLLLSKFKKFTCFSQQYQQKRIQFVSKYKSLKDKINQQTKQGFLFEIFTFLCNPFSNKQRKRVTQESMVNNSISNKRQSMQQRLNSKIFREFTKLLQKLEDYEHYKSNTILVFLTVVQYFQQLTDFNKQFEDINKYFDEFLNNFIALKLGQIDKLETNNLLFITIESKLKDIYSKYSRWKSY